MNKCTLKKGPTYASATQAVTPGSASLIRALGFGLETRGNVVVLKWSHPKQGCRPALHTEIAMWQKLTSPNR